MKPVVYTDMSLSRLWSRAAGTQSSFEDLVGPHIDHLYRLAYRFTSKREDAEDLVQDLLVKLYGRNRDLHNIEKLRPWLARVLYRLFIDKTRQAGRSVLNAVDDEVAPDERSATDATIESIVEGTLTREKIQQAIACLNEDQRVLLAFHDIEGYTLIELVDVLDVPLGTLKSRLNRARAKLRQELADMEPFEVARRVNR
ncbi:MAG: RNA polymerase sigma factor [Acidiferrobacterales bacterium]